MDGCVKCIGLIVCPHFAHLSQISPRALGRASFEICEGVRSLFVRNGVAPYNERVGQGCECVVWLYARGRAANKVRGKIRRRQVMSSEGVKLDVAKTIYRTIETLAICGTISILGCKVLDVLTTTPSQTTSELRSASTIGGK